MTRFCELGMVHPNDQMTKFIRKKKDCIVIMKIIVLLLFVICYYL